MAELDRDRDRGPFPMMADPTPLTTAQILREISMLKELMTTHLEAVDKRFTAIDKATELFEANLTRVPTETQRAVGTLKDLVYETFKTIDTKFESIGAQFGEKFESVDQRFKERDTRSERESRDNKVAVDAAFAAQKEAASEQNKSNTLAIDKSEKATAETLNKQADLFKSTTDTLDGKIGDDRQTINKLDGRLTTIESRGIVVRETQTQTNWGIGTMLSAFAVLISLAGLIIILIKLG
jgi:uncharacterized phage infection (PIP) family protein YhgE